MKNAKQNLLAAAGLFLVANAGAYAAGLHAVQPIPGYVCMNLTLTDEEMADPKITVPIRSEPADSAPVAATAAATVFVAKPADASNGYLRVLRLNGKEGWIKADMVKPWSSPNGNPSVTCTPSMMSNGRPGFDIK